MGSLNQDAGAVVRAGRSALRPTAADRDRLEAALATRLGPHAFPPSPTVTPNAHGVMWRAIGGAAVGACVIGGALMLTSPSKPGAPPERPGVSHSPPGAEVVTDQPLSTAPSVPELPTLTTADSAVRATPSAPRRQDALTQEVALLSRAVAALNAGRAGEALAALNEHQRQFPHGILGTERQAAKARALCSLGRVTEGRAELAHLSPRSPAAGRAKQVCDSAPASRPNQR